ncbi:hypothetical protein VB773_12800 [Haloarculaceae archaeon H-GB2-1]|nr:hypothetical protein [Haloarculaceae archaeon H-GB2-1]
MDRVVLRALMALVGLLTLFVYLAGAVLSYAALRIVLTGPSRRRPLSRTSSSSRLSVDT